MFRQINRWRNKTTLYLHVMYTWKVLWVECGRSGSSKLRMIESKMEMECNLMAHIRTSCLLVWLGSDILGKEWDYQSVRVQFSLQLYWTFPKDVRRIFNMFRKKRIFRQIELTFSRILIFHRDFLDFSIFTKVENSWGNIEKMRSTDCLWKTAPGAHVGESGRDALYTRRYFFKKCRCRYAFFVLKMVLYWQYPATTWKTSKECCNIGGSLKRCQAKHETHWKQAWSRSQTFFHRSGCRVIFRLISHGSRTCCQIVGHFLVMFGENAHRGHVFPSIIV